jgi:hypothetical protein
MEEELRLVREQLGLAMILLARTIPLLDLQISEHNDGVRLRKDVMWFMAGLGYPGYLTTRKEEWS